jgi:hypothetical protein
VNGYTKGWPDLSPWSKGEFLVSGMNGVWSHDRKLIYEEIARVKGWLKADGSSNASAAERWLSATRSRRTTSAERAFS